MVHRIAPFALLERIVIAACSIICFFEARSQNLVPNPGFETYTTCPGSDGVVNFAPPWISPTTGSTDFFHSCAGTDCAAGTPWVCVPTNWTGSEMPHGGEGYAGLFVTWDGVPDYREYVQAQLSEPLQAGTVYTVSFYVSLADDGQKATSNIGAYLSAQAISGFDYNPLSAYDPQVQASSVVDNKNGWTHISGCFTATGGERYITIGNFDLYANSTFVTVAGGSTLHSYYYVDDVSVVAGANSSDLLGDDAVICPGDSLVFDFSGPNTTVLWQDGSTDAVYSITSAGRYWVDVTNDCGTSTDTIDVMVSASPPFALGPDTAMCAGGTVLLDATMAGAVGYTWNVGSGGALLSVHEPGLYWVNVELGCGQVSDTIEVELRVPAVIDLGPDTSFCAGSGRLLSAAADGATYLWQDGSTSDQLLAAGPGTYWVRVINPCLSSDTVRLVVVACDPLIDMPNVFSPNGDGSNDSFVPRVIQDLDNAVLRIYNRWGMLVHETRDLVTGWNGRVAGDPCAEGIYYWVLDLGELVAGKDHLTGYLTLLR